MWESSWLWLTESLKALAIAAEKMHLISNVYIFKMSAVFLIQNDIQREARRKVPKLFQTSHYCRSSWSKEVQIPSTPWEHQKIKPSEILLSTKWKGCMFMVNQTWIYDVRIITIMVDWTQCEKMNHQRITTVGIPINREKSSRLLPVTNTRTEQ